MSFVLPGNARQLRFTGEVKAFTDESTGGSPGGNVALGKPRVRKATTVPPPPAPVEARTILGPPGQPTSRGSQRPITMTPASPGNRVNTPVPASSYGNAAIRQKMHDVDEDQQATMALDREAYDILPGGMNAGMNAGMNGSQRPTRSPMAGAGQVSAAAIPHFRPANPAAQTFVVPNQTGSHDVRGRGAPLALWIFAAVLAGVLSYHVTPALMSHFESPPPAHTGG